jgi:hypothetical protein
MMISTPNGLNFAVTEPEMALIEELNNKVDIHDALLDTELWASAPGGAASIAAVAVGLGTESALYTWVAALSVFLFVRVGTQFFYSPFLRVVIPQLLGVWFIAIPASLFSAWVLHGRGATGVGVSQVAITLGAHFGVLDLVSILAGPFLRPYGAERTAFLSSVHRQAKACGIDIDWSRTRPAPPESAS